MIIVIPNSLGEFQGRLVPRRDLPAPDVPSLRHGPLFFFIPCVKTVAGDEPVDSWGDIREGLVGEGILGEGFGGEG